MIRHTMDQLSTWDRETLMHAVQTLETELAEVNDRANGEWTPVSTQLPPDDWTLIVVDFHEPYRRRMVLRGYYDPHDHTWRTRQGRIKPHWEVTHWQPLPDLPE